MGNKGRLVNSQNWSRDDRGAGEGGGGEEGRGAAIFDRVGEENANESRSETIEWLEKTTVLSLVLITKRLRPRCVKFGELTELPDV